MNRLLDYNFEESEHWEYTNGHECVDKRMDGHECVDKRMDDACSDCTELF